MQIKFLLLIFGMVIGGGATLLFNTLGASNKTTFEELPEPYYKILFENETVRIVEHKLHPGQTEPMHNHPPMFVYFLQDAEAIVSGPDGRSQLENLNKGQTLIVPALSHTIENPGKSTLHSILVEFKE